MSSQYNNSKAISISLLLLGLIALCGTAQAKCSRADADYYLKKGLTRNQVAAICKKASATESSGDSHYKAYDAASNRMRREETTDHNRQQLALLKAAIRGRDVELTAKWLGYTNKLCITTVTYDAATRTKICPKVKYRIYFRNLKIKKAEKAFFSFGQQNVDVKGKVKRKLLHNFEQYPSATRRQLLRVYKAKVRKGRTLIPIRKGYSPDQVSVALRHLVRQASAQKRKDSRK